MCYCWQIEVLFYYNNVCATLWGTVNLFFYRTKIQTTIMFFFMVVLMISTKSQLSHHRWIEGRNIGTLPCFESITARHSLSSSCNITIWYRLETIENRVWLLHKVAHVKCTCLSMKQRFAYVQHSQKLL